MPVERKRTAELPSLDGIFRPRSVAVIGVSRDRNSIGQEIIANLLSAGFTGPVYPVNPKAAVIHSMKCYPSLAAIEDPVDLAVIVVPSALVIPVARDCAKKGVKGLVVITSGFREIGGKGILLEEKLMQIARKAGMRVIGPNCMGVLNSEESISLNATFAAAKAQRGVVCFVSQSGALGEAILSVANDTGLGIRMFASVGNRADVGAHDLLEYWEKDKGTELILLYLEAFGDPARFKAVAERLRGKKPIIAVKSGRSKAGARAAGSHTGSVAGEDIVVDTFMNQCGVLRASSLREMFAFATAMLNQPPPAGDRIAVLTNAGGPGILATDALAGFGLELAEFTKATVRKLRQALPKEASIVNPVDLLASADAARYQRALKALVADPGVHALLVLFVSPQMIDAQAVAQRILEETRGKGKPVLACIMGRERNDEALQLLREGGIPVFDFPEEAASTLAGLIRQRSLAMQPTGRVMQFKVDVAALSRVFAKHRKDGGWLSSRDVRKVLLAYGIPVIAAKTVKSPAAAAEAAHGLGYPVCLKAIGKDILHKSDVGGVHLGLENGDLVVDAARSMIRRMRTKTKGLELEVQAMAKGHRELLMGFIRDDRFGPRITVGFGGTLVEVLKDVVVRVGPLTDRDPVEMLASLRGAVLLDAYRGDPAVDKACVGECLLRLNQLAFDFPEIGECEINPFIVAVPGEQSAAVDARIYVKQRS